MKRLTYLLSTLAFVLIFSGSTFAQAGTQSVTAKTEIIASLSFSNITALNFGQLPTNITNTPSIDPSGTNSNVGTGAEQGQVTINTANSQSLSVTITDPANLTNSGGTTPISFTGDHYGEAGDNTGALSSLTSGSSNSVTAGGSGVYHIYLGGTLATGTYDAATYDQSSITVEVDFQ